MGLWGEAAADVGIHFRDPGRSNKSLSQTQTRTAHPPGRLVLTPRDGDTPLSEQNRAFACGMFVLFI